MALNPNGAVSAGFKIGRCSAEIFVTNLTGEVLFKQQKQYEIAIPDSIFEFMETGLRQAEDILGSSRASKLCGVGVGMPFEIWKWETPDDDLRADFQSWNNIVFEEKLARFIDLPIFLINDATSACWAEHQCGRGRDLGNYAYFLLSTLIGGGVVLNQVVFEGSQHNAGAFGPVRIGDKAGRTRQLLDVASICVLENRFKEAGHDPHDLWVHPQDWRPFSKLLGYLD